MTDYGVTPAGFVVKPFIDILNAKLDLARSLFGPDVDLRSTSALRKILDIASAEDQEHWKALEGAYYANFVSTASTDALDLLGDDLGLQRDNQQATGQVTFTLTNEAPARNYILPVGTLVETAAPAIRFRTTDITTLSSQQKTATIGASAVVTGPAGNVPKAAIAQINPIYAGHHLSLGTATIAATNSAPFTGGDLLADDETYRARLLRLPRTLFTVQAISAAALNVDGVRDCKLSDPLGGVDVSLSIFNSFVFDRRRFGQARFLGTPYFFDVLVAPQPGYAWERIAGVTGLPRCSGCGGRHCATDRRLSQHPVGGRGRCRGAREHHNWPRDRCGCGRRGAQDRLREPRCRPRAWRCGTGLRGASRPIERVGSRRRAEPALAPVPADIRLDRLRRPRAVPGRGDRGRHRGEPLAHPR